jgi:hypothetical protein
MGANQRRINENGRFDKPDTCKLSGKELEAAWKKYDNDLFQTGRLITCGLYANIILKDYGASDETPKDRNS